MSFINKNFSDKPSLLKPAIAVVAIVLVIGCVYFIGSKASSESDSSENEVKSTGLNPKQKINNVGDVEEVIAKWIEANPEAVLVSLQNMQQKAAANKSQNAQKNISAKRDELFNDKGTPSHSPSGYDVTIVEFFDYACGYCKRANATVKELIKSDKKVKVVYKEFPILGAPSVEMSALALAVHIMQPKSYIKFHNALMKSKERGQAGALKIAKSVGIDPDRLKDTLVKNQAKITAQVQANLELGGAVGVSGTPGFIIGEELIPGAVGLDALKEKIKALRNK